MRQCCRILVPPSPKFVSGRSAVACFSTLGFDLPDWFRNSKGDGSCAGLDDEEDDIFVLPAEPNVSNEQSQSSGSRPLSIRPPAAASHEDAEFEADVDEVSRILSARFASPEAIVIAMDCCSVRVTGCLVDKILTRFSNDWVAALGFFLWASTQGGYCHRSDSYDLMVDILGKFKQFDLMWDLINQMVEVGGLISLMTMTKVMRRLAGASRWTEAINAFHKIDRFGVLKDTKAMNVLLDTLCKERSVKRARGAFQELRETIPPDESSFNTLIHGWCKARMLKEAVETMEEMKQHGFSPSVVTYTSLVEAYCNEKDFQTVYTLLDEMHKRQCLPNVITYTIVMHALGKAGRTRKALDTFDKLKEDGVSPDASFYNSLIYILGRAGRLEDAYSVVEEMRRTGIPPNVTTFNTLISAACDHSQAENALKLLVKMEEQSCKPDIKTYTPLLKLCCKRQWKGFTPKQETFDLVMEKLEMRNLQTTYKKINILRTQAVDEVPRIFQFGGRQEYFDIHERNLSKFQLSFEIICAVTAALMLEVFKMDEEMSEHETELLLAGWYSTMRSKLKLMHVLKSFEMGRGSKLFIPIWDKMASNWDSLMIDLENMFMDFIQLTDEHFLTNCSTPQSFVFYYKTKGDYYHYISGLTVSAKKKTYAILSAESYEHAANIAEKTLAPSNPLMIDLSLSICFFAYNIMDFPITAYRIGKGALDQAVSELSALDGETRKEAVRMIEYFVEAGAIAMRRVRKEDLRHVAKGTGATMVSTFADMEGEETFDSSYFGHADEVGEERIADDDVIMVKGTKNTSAVVAGGGAVEAALSVYLENLATTLGSREQLTIAEYAESMLITPKVLSVNAAKDATELVAKLRAYHHTAQTKADKQRLSSTGLDLSNGIVCNNLEHGVIEPAMSKVKIIQFATEAAITIMRIDDMIKLSKEDTGNADECQ
ncbi:hypothetical protein E2562_024669 [Oryza meyeriana var. granulata]|uniref:14-3-3 domain-containing protein n=1 Tax=Oryza meyeriana var. granulata TaxID=110450 RepID=A0A6G1EBH7_9ORYZ|nr:hypothetical protein E2562_024669 [Oryza meyeriana var. granulata]